MSKNKAFIEHIHAKEYEELLPQRLSRDALGEQQILTLLVQEHSQSADAYRLFMNAEQLQRDMGDVAFKAVMLTADFQPAWKPIHSTMTSDNMWSGKICVKSRGRTFVTPNGFIAPYEDAVDWSGLEVSEPVSTLR